MSMDKVVPNNVHKVNFYNGSIEVALDCDVVHRFEWLGFHLLKYYDAETRCMRSMPLRKEMVDFIVDRCDLLILDRPTITESEHEIFLRCMTESLVADAYASADNEPEPEDEL